MPWHPTTIRRPDKAYRTATDAVRVTTDAGPGFLKALGNHGGPHLLAAEWVGTHLVRSIPPEWQVSNEGRDALVKLIGDRAHYVADTFGPALQPRLV